MSATMIQLSQTQHTVETTSAGLALFFTLGVSLTDWERTGYLHREVMYYERLAESVGPITFVTYGGEADLALQNKLGGIRLLANTQQLRPQSFERRVARMHRNALAEAAVLKSSQIKGAGAVINAAAMTGAKS